MHNKKLVRHPLGPPQDGLTPRFFSPDTCNIHSTRWVFAGYLTWAIVKSICRAPYSARREKSVSCDRSTARVESVCVALLFRSPSPFSTRSNGARHLFSPRTLFQCWTLLIISVSAGGLRLWRQSTHTLSELCTY